MKEKDVFNEILSLQIQQALNRYKEYHSRHRSVENTMCCIYPNFLHSVRLHISFIIHVLSFDGIIFSMLLLLLFAFRDLWKECGDSNFYIFFLQNCQFHHRRLESLGNLMCLIYIFF